MVGRETVEWRYAAAVENRAHRVWFAPRPTNSFMRSASWGHVECCSVISIQHCLSILLFQCITWRSVFDVVGIQAQACLVSLLPYFRRLPCATLSSKIFDSLANGETVTSALNLWRGGGVPNLRAIRSIVFSGVVRVCATPVLLWADFVQNT